MRILRMNLWNWVIFVRKTTSHSIQNAFREKIFPGMLIGGHNDLIFLIIVYLALQKYPPSAYTEYTREDLALYPNGTIDEFLGSGPILDLN